MPERLRLDRVAPVEDRKLTRFSCACARPANLATGTTTSFASFTACDVTAHAPLNLARFNPFVQPKADKSPVPVPSSWTTTIPRDASNNPTTQFRCNWAAAVSPARLQLTAQTWTQLHSTGTIFPPRHRQSPPAARSQASMNLSRRKSQAAQRPLTTLEHASTRRSPLATLARSTLQQIIGRRQAIFRCQAIHFLEIRILEHYLLYIHLPRPCRIPHRSSLGRSVQFSMVWDSR